MLYRMLSVLLSALLLLSLAACGPGKTPPDTSAPSSAPGGPASEASTPEAPGGIDPAAVVAVEEAVRLYQSGTTPENATQLPEGFVFPEVLDWDSISAIPGGENGGLKISVPSVSMASPRGNVTITGQEYAEFWWDGSALMTVSFRLARSETVIPGREW